MLLQHKSVVITGAGSGVGRAASLIFAQQGARVVCSDLKEEWAAETVRQVRDAGGTAVTQVCDVRREADLIAAINRAVAEFGRLDIMFNNAGVATATDGKGHRLIDQGDDDFDRLVSINQRGVYYGCRQAVIRFHQQGDRLGVIVNTASVAGMVGMGGVLYGSTKGAVIQLTRALAVEVAKDGIRVNAVCPCGMLTNFGRPDDHAFGAVSPELAERINKMHPLGRAITPEDTANAALFLASDMAKNITGVVLPVDGGYTAA
jgi:NAD(P)-dependent dehydrogenase (short-subunit alcohol dehydrogenase family)